MVTVSTGKIELPSLPSGWSWTPIGDLLEFKNGLNKSKQYFGYGTPIVNYMDVFNHASVVSSDIKGRVDVDTSELRSFEVRKGDVLFTRTSETVDEVGISCAVLEDMPDTVFSGFVLRGRPKNTTLADSFKQYVFSCEQVRQQITSTATYTTRALTNGRALSAINLPVPDSKSEQLAIAEALNDVDASINSLKKLLEKKSRLFIGMRDQLMAGQIELGMPESFWSDYSFEEAFQFLATATNPRDDLTQAGGESLYIHYGDIHSRLATHLDTRNQTLPQLKRGIRVKSKDVKISKMSENIKDKLKLEVRKER